MPQETNLNSLEGTMPQPGQSAGTLGNLTTALKSALSEAAERKATSRMQEMSGLTEMGTDPSVISAAVGLARSGLKQTQADIFKDVTETYTREQDRADARRQSIYNNINTMIDNDVFADTPDEVLLSMEKEAGATPGTFLAYKVQNKANKKLDDETRAKQNRLLDIEIQTKLQDLSGAGGLPKAIKADFDETMASISTEKNRESALKSLDNLKTSLISKYGEENYNKLLKEVDRIFPPKQQDLTKAQPSKPQAASVGKKIKETSAYLQTLGGRPEIIGGTLVEGSRSIGSFFSGLFGN